MGANRRLSIKIRRIMENTKKIKLFIGLSYLLIICLFLHFLFSKFSLSEITSYDFIRDNQSYFFELKKSNLFLISIIFFSFNYSLGFPFFRIWISSCFNGWFYIWKMDRYICCCFRLEYWRYLRSRSNLPAVSVDSGLILTVCVRRATRAHVDAIVAVALLAGTIFTDVTLPSVVVVAGELLPLQRFHVRCRAVDCGTADYNGDVSVRLEFIGSGVAAFPQPFHASYKSDGTSASNI